MKTARLRSFRREHLDDMLGPFQRLRPIRPPHRGWIHEVRNALGMSAAQLAARMGVSQPAVSQMEAREPDGTVTLNLLRQAADALDCDVVYALVPRAGSLTKSLENRARHVATDTVGRVSHTMRLEDQAVSERVRREQEDDLVRELMSDPRTLWAKDVG